jgi:hypothetical protein
LRPLYETLSTTGSRADYALRMATPDSDAIIVLERGVHRSLSAAVRAERRRGFKATATRVRGRSGRLLTRRNARILVWAEAGKVYWLGSGTPRKVSLKDLRDTANGLQRLGGYYIGGHADPNNSSEGDAATTDRAISIRVSWEAQCGDGIRVGNAFAFMVPRTGDTFSFDIAQHRILSGEWNGTVTGTIRPGAIDLTVDASAVIDGRTCVSGQVALTLTGGARAAGTRARGPVTMPAAAGPGPRRAMVAKRPRRFDTSDARSSQRQMAAGEGLGDQVSTRTRVELRHRVADVRPHRLV